MTDERSSTNLGSPRCAPSFESGRRARAQMTTFMMHDRGDMTKFIEDDVVAELPWEPVERFIALAEAEALEAAEVRKARRASREAIGLFPGAKTPADAVVLADMEFLIALKHIAVSAADLSTHKALELEEKLGVPRGTLVKMLCHEEPSATEYSYNPVRRYNALAHTFREPRGAKTLDEKECLRQVPLNSGLNPSPPPPNPLTRPCSCGTVESIVRLSAPASRAPQQHRAQLLSLIHV